MQISTIHDARNSFSKNYPFTKKNLKRKRDCQQYMGELDTRSCEFFDHDGTYDFESNEHHFEEWTDGQGKNSYPPEFFFFHYHCSLQGEHDRSTITIFLFLLINVSFFFCYSSWFMTNMFVFKHHYIRCFFFFEKLSVIDLSCIVVEIFLIEN
ncbi:hypothetical protein RFI_37885 [Reticulomyxa filosa]|uniref:Uncharacterized protein n=1 Tax=Reticulomyxa filosa TaxID=46433 RepID=X6LFR4_RETFI|nr:hypothetical protein RFI_37885 [Reticulomyxa filosa]|eukprot:ETN99584.1 hypothetical protein RFI_37885 [Reticulomyxa filosa]